MTYRKAVRLIGDLWERVVGSEMPELVGKPSQMYLDALRLIEQELVKSKSVGDALKGGLHEASLSDPVLKELIGDSYDETGALVQPNEIDDISPNTFKAAALAEAQERAPGDEPDDADLDAFLKGTVTRIKKELGWTRRINIGPNRHFPRMLQWLRELEDDTWSEEGRGIHIFNPGGGRVAALPEGPGTLKVRINPNFL